MGFVGFGSALDILELHLIILIAGFSLVFAFRVKHKAYVAILSVVLSALPTSILALQGIRSGGIEVMMYAGSLIGNVPFRIDGLAGWFILIVNFLSVTGVLYGAGYLRAYSVNKSSLNLHWVSFLLFQASMFWVCSVQNGLAFILVWEIMSLSSLMLVIFNFTDQKVLKAGVNYLVQMHLSVAALTVGFLWVYAA